MSAVPSKKVGGRKEDNCCVGSSEEKGGRMRE
jgi:hypothetical protein